MGAWDAGNFGNDDALDWIGELCENGSTSSVRSALTQAIAQSTPQQPSLVGKLLGRQPVEAYLEAPIASEALAAAEIVACWLGHPLAKLPDGVAEWVQEHSHDFSPAFVQLAREAVAHIKTKSELKELWEEGDAKVAAEWHAVIADLEQRLNN
ncbi:MAG: DUF4259 domain-containing protein [Steroidobacteraceae bacterium]